VRAAGRVRGAAVAVELPRTGPRTGRPLPDLRLGVHHRPVAGRRCPQTLAAPILDLGARPEFAAKAARVLDLYARIWNGQPLGSNDYVICADEKTSIQARCRCHPTLPPGKARAMRVEHDYRRGGALAYLAAWDVHRAQVIGRCEHTTGIAPFSRLVQQVMTAEPYASADRVFWIVDNGSSHRGAASIQRMTKAWPNAHLIHLPAHASWLDQAEIYFSVVQRKALTPNDFTDLAQIRSRLAAFEVRYNVIAKPFNWKFTRTNLNDLLRRIDAREKNPPHALAA
jgi:DDE superfamily endonuclease